MAVYVECRACHQKQALKNVSCRKCGHDIGADRKKNQANYWTYLRYRGEQYWERVGGSLTIAREQEKIKRAGLVKEEYSPADKSARLQSFGEKHYLPWAEREKRSYRMDKYRLAVHLLPFFGNAKLSDIKPAQVEQFKQARIREGAKNSTVNRDLALLKTILNKAAKWGMFNGQNPVSIAGMLPENNLDVARALTEEDAEKLLSELSEETRPAIEFMLATGIRKDNVLSLKWDQIDRANKVVVLPRTKSGKPLRIPLNDWALDILQRVPRHIRSPYVFCHLSSGDRYADVRHGFKSALVRAGLDPSIRVHDLRHTCASWMASKGVPTSVLKDLLGHSTLAMVSRYSHLGHDTLLEMSNKISRPFGKDANQSANKASEQ